jgi:EAL domain-containing protein (putative c-di-GMP-specific phosphodiesterase class I)
MYAAARDITERKLEEERLRAPALALERRTVADRERIMNIIEIGSFAPVFQPIIDLEAGAIVGFEALTRFADGESPAAVFATAAECGLGATLELATVSGAMAAARELPRGAWLSINLSPSTLTDVDGVRRALGLRIRPLIVEITEHETITAYGRVRDAVRALGPDVRLAVDDAGAGVANFNHLVELRPDFVKVDAGLVRGVGDDVSRQAFIAGIVHFAASAGCEVIAEGIETEVERDALHRLGVRLGQGFLLGRPACAGDWESVPGDVRTLRRAAGPARRRAAG